MDGGYDEADQIKLENRVKLQIALDTLRGVSPGYGITAKQLRVITKPLAVKIQQMYVD